MRIYLLLTALIGISFSGGNLSGGNVDHISATAYLMTPPLVDVVAFVEKENIEGDVTQAVEVSEETQIEVEVIEVVEEITEVVETEEIVEETETYDLIHQKDVGEVEESVPPEVSETWYVEDTATIGLEAILAAYAITEYDFFILSTPSNYIYQYDFYMDSPDGSHSNLIGIYQYDATGQHTFYLDPITGSWE